MIRVRRAIFRLTTTLARRSRDLLAVAGVASVAYGIAGWSLQLAFIVVGAFLVFAAGAGRKRAV